MDLPWRRMVDELVAALSCRVWTRRPTRRHSVFGAEWGDERGRDERRTGGTADWRNRYGAGAEGRAMTTTGRGGGEEEESRESVYVCW